MSLNNSGRVFDLIQFRDRTGVFADRHEAGHILSLMLTDFRGEDAIVLAIPSGGVPVGAAIAWALRLPLDVAVVSKITPPFSSEVGYGAIAFDGSVQMNETALPSLGLTEQEIRRGISET